MDREELIKAKAQIGTRIRETRKARGLTQVQLAALVGPENRSMLILLHISG